MANNAVCTVCGSFADDWIVAFGQAVRGPEGEWRQLEEQDERDLCDACVAPLQSALVKAGARRPLPTPSKLVPGIGACDFCSARLTQTAYTLELVPVVQPGRANSLQAPMRQYRVDIGCLLWVRGAIAAARSRVASRGAQFPIVLPPIDVASAGLETTPETVLRQVVMSAGGNVVPVEYLFDGVLFMPASRHKLAFKYASSTSAQRAILAVRIRPETRDADMARLFPFHLVAAPLSRERIAGAVDRALSPDLLGMDRDTSLPVWRVASGRFGQPAHILSIDVNPGLRQEVAWACRQVLRGCDRIGIDEQGRLTVAVYCPDSAIARVRARLAFTLEGTATVRIIDRKDPSNDGLSRTESAVPGRPHTSAMRFVSQALANAQTAEAVRSRAS